MKLILAIVFLCGIAGGCTIEPYWHDGACVADDDKIHVHWQADILTPCHFPSGGGYNACTIRNCPDKSAEIYLSTLMTADKQCAAHHEWQHAKGKVHADGAMDCAPRS